MSDTAPVSEQVARTASPTLRGAVERTVGYRLLGHPAGTHAGLPSPTITVVVSFDDPLTLSVLPDGRKGPLSMWAMASGLHDTPAQILHDGNQHGVQLDVSPLHSRALFGMPAAALTRQTAPLAELLGGHDVELADRLEASASWGTRFDILDEVLSARLDEVDRNRRRHGTEVRPELVHAWTRLCDDGAPVSVVADELGWSRRHLRTQCRAEFGLNPSTLVRIARFHRAQRWVRSRPEESLAVAAAWCGYADQSHMTREWSELAGAPPRTWLRDEQFPSVQDHERAEVAG
ncbi:MAG: helix-turn-helix domain-containing protein [Actinomycetota bacterium]|nr:helix-turn-helix domain-containing protein [Actinomycetota bacterium]